MDRQETNADRLTHDIGVDIMTDYPGCVVVEATTRTEQLVVVPGISIGWTLDSFANPVYVFPITDDMIRIYLRKTPLMPLLTPVLPGPDRAYVVNRETLHVHPDEPPMSMFESKGFLRASMDRLEYTLHKQRYARMIRFALDAKKMDVMKLEDFSGPGKLMM